MDERGMIRLRVNSEAMKANSDQQLQDEAAKTAQTHQ